jgi:hypothetical protein
VVALTATRSYELVREVLAERAPTVGVVDLPTVTPYPWLEDPRLIDQLVRELLDR